MSQTTRIYDVTPMLASMFLATADPFVVDGEALDEYRRQLREDGKFSDPDGPTHLVAYDHETQTLVGGHHLLLAILLEDIGAELTVREYGVGDGGGP